MPDKPSLRGVRGFQQSGAEETVAFLLGLRARGVRDTALLRAMETVSRDLFAPRRFSDLARADVSLPLSCGQTMTAPGIIAAMLVALKLAPHHAVLEIGTGSGYLAAVMGKLSSHVVSVERYKTLAISASERLAKLGLDNVCIIPGDGLARETIAGGRYDRIILNGTLPGAFPASLLAALADDGILIGARSSDGVSRLVRVTHDSEDQYAEEDLGAIRLPPLSPGVAKVL